MNLFSGSRLHRLGGALAEDSRSVRSAAEEAEEGVQGLLVRPRRLELEPQPVHFKRVDPQRLPQGLGLSDRYLLRDFSSKINSSISIIYSGMVIKKKKIINFIAF